MKIALAQIAVKDGSVKHNMNKVLKFIEWAKNEGAEAVFFPELALTGFDTVIEIKDIKLETDILVGLGAAIKEGGVVYNAYLLIKDGILYIRKKHVLFKPMQEDKKFREGNLPVAVELSGWTLSVLICYELRFPELFGLTLGRTNAFVVPAAWPSSRIEHWRTLLVARALENAAYVVGVNRWGPGTHGPFGGNSCVVDPLGARRCMGEGEGLLVVELEKERVEEARRFPALADRLKLRGTLPSAGRRSDRG